MSTKPRKASKRLPVRPAENRRERIADAVLEILATQGARALTHRAADRALGLADGSTSFYFRTRSAMLLAAAERLVELDTADIEHVSEDPEGMAGLIVRWASRERRTRSLARLELLLTAARDPAFRFMKDAREQLIAQVARTDRRSTAAGARITGVALVALTDGLILQGLLAGKLTRGDTRRVLERLSRKK